MVDPNDLKEILYNISKKIIVPSFGNLKSNQISYKNEKDIVTEIDLAVELELSIFLLKLLICVLKNRGACKLELRYCLARIPC